MSAAEVLIIRIKMHNWNINQRFFLSFLEISFYHGVIPTEAHRLYTSDSYMDESREKHLWNGCYLKSTLSAGGVEQRKIPVSHSRCALIQQNLQTIPKLPPLLRRWRSNKMGLKNALKIDSSIKQKSYFAYDYSRSTGKELLVYISGMLNIHESW